MGCVRAACPCAAAGAPAGAATLPLLLLLCGVRPCRKAIEDFLERPVYLELSVQVSPSWRNKVDSLKEYGYFDPLLM
jgi:hypothetical protein